MDDKGMIYLVDFGWAVHTPDKRLRQTQCGTPLYQAPEMTFRKGYSNCIDLWCIGIICYELLTGDAPFQD